MKKIMSFVFAAFFAAATANAAVLVTEDFSYADGSLTSNPAWNTHSGTAGQVQVLGGEVILDVTGSSSEDVNIDFGAVASDILTASFDMTVTAAAPAAGTDTEYFAHFFSTGSFNFTSRLDVVPGTSGGDYTLGIATSSSSTEAVLGVDFAYGALVPVVLAYDFGTGLASVTAGGSTQFSTTVATEADLNLFAFRQSGSSTDETIVIDNLVISGTVVPEPTSVALVLFGASAFGAVSMRRRLG